MGILVAFIFALNLIADDCGSNSVDVCSSKRADIFSVITSKNKSQQHRNSVFESGASKTVVKSSNVVNSTLGVNGVNIESEVKGGFENPVMFVIVILGLVLLYYYLRPSRMRIKKRTYNRTYN